MHRLCAVLAFCLISCGAAFSQASGIIQCAADAKSVPAWTAPESAYVFEQLSCGQTVQIIEMEKGYYKIQFGNHFGYVNSKDIRFQEEPQAPLAERTEQAQKAEQTPQKDRAAARRYEGELAFDISRIRYSEASLGMKESGIMLGAYGEFIERRKKLMFKYDARFSLGDVAYSSPSGEFDNIRDYSFETRYSLGYSLKSTAKGSLTPFAGIGFRYLHDNLDSAGPGGYDRKSKYLYSPLGMEGLVRLRGGWALGLSAEYDLFWHGWQNSEMGDACSGCNTLKNGQHDGWGARGSIKIVRTLGKREFAIEPFFRYWDIDTSDLQSITYQGNPVGVGWEPANISKEWGTRIGIRF
jgi:hypothetical protein